MQLHAEGKAVRCRDEDQGRGEMPTLTVTRMTRRLTQSRSFGKLPRNLHYCLHRRTRFPWTHPEDPEDPEDPEVKRRREMFERCIALRLVYGCGLRGAC